MEITLSQTVAREKKHPHIYRLLELLTLWHERQRQRRALLKLDDRLLSDIGISRCEAEQEASKPFWKA